jgi:hypothetical protein
VGEVNDRLGGWPSKAGTLSSDSLRVLLPRSLSGTGTPSMGKEERPVPANARHKRTAGSRSPSPDAGTRVAIVTRISTDEVNQPYSLEAQAKGLEAFVASQPGLTITHRFVGQASGATLDRPGLQAALTSCPVGRMLLQLLAFLPNTSGAYSSTGLVRGSNARPPAGSSSGSRPLRLPA